MTAPRYKSAAYLQLQRRAGMAVAEAVRRGDLPRLATKKVKCVDCLTRRATDWEHRDYLRPLDVEPVCTQCNAARGRTNNHARVMRDIESDREPLFLFVSESFAKRIAALADAEGRSVGAQVVWMVERCSAYEKAPQFGEAVWQHAARRGAA